MTDPSQPRPSLYTPEQRWRRDHSMWTLVQGILAPLQFLVFLVSLVLDAAVIVMVFERSATQAGIDLPLTRTAIIAVARSATVGGHASLQEQSGRQHGHRGKQSHGASVPRRWLGLIVIGY